MAQVSVSLMVYQYPQLVLEVVTAFVGTGLNDDDETLASWSTADGWNSTYTTVVAGVKPKLSGMAVVPRGLALFS